MTGSPRSNPESGHRGARTMHVFGRKPGRSAGCQGGRAGEAVFTYRLTRVPCHSAPTTQEAAHRGYEPHAGVSLRETE